jgi:hypothetical protein
MRRHIFSEQLDEYIREHWYEQGMHIGNQLPYENIVDQKYQFFACAQSLEARYLYHLH